LTHWTQKRHVWNPIPGFGQEQKCCDLKIFYQILYVIYCVSDAYIVLPNTGQVAYFNSHLWHDLKQNLKVYKENKEIINYQPYSGYDNEELLLYICIHVYNDVTKRL
jgi:hypothetical protein